MVSTVDVTIRTSKKSVLKIAQEKEEKNTEEKILCPWQQSVVDGKTILGKDEWNGKMGKKIELNEDIKNVWVEDVEEGLTQKGLSSWYKTGI